MKQDTPIEKTISGTNFYIVPFPAFTAAKVSGDLSKLLAPVIGKLSPLLEDVDDNGDFLDIDMNDILPIIADALGTLSGDGLEALAKELLVDYKNVSYENERGQVEKLTYDTANEIFCADIMGMIMLGIEVVQVNFKGFFRNLVTQFGGQPASMALAETITGMKSGAN